MKIALIACVFWFAAGGVAYAAAPAPTAEYAQEGAGAACAGPLWSVYDQCKDRRIAATVSGGVNATTSGEFTVERPTLGALGFDWRTSGDENRTASVRIRYRRVGDKLWSEGLPLHRLHGERVPSESPPLRYVVPNMFSGSLLDLRPDTEYEVHLTLSDPDGVSGEAEKAVTLRTRAEPRPAEDGRVFHVYPFGYEGERKEPSFTGLNAAYYLEGWRHADWSNVSAPRVRPGDTILVHAGIYLDARTEYGTRADRPSLGTPFDGTYYLTQSGTPDRPIVIKAAGDGEVVFDGGGNHNLFNLLAANYNYFEGITVRNTEVGFLLGMKNIIGSSGFTLKRSRIENVGRGVHSDWSGSRDFYIADNVFVGRHDPAQLIGWQANGPWASLPGFPERISGPQGSEYAVKVYGQGHVVAFNRVEHFHDGIDIASYADPDGAPDELPGRIPVAIDILSNDIFAMGDNCIEADGGARNIRVMRNRCFNTAGGAISAQPLFGGPLYLVRNVVVQGVGESLKFSISPAGVLVYHNTFLSESNGSSAASNSHFRNNLLLSHGKKGRGYSVSAYTNYSSSDYNGFYNAPGIETPYAWNSPPFETRADYGAPVERRFAGLKAYSAATGQDRHSAELGHDVFVKAPVPDPAQVARLYRPDDYDLRLRRQSRAIDAGVALANVNDGHAGRAPDLGAYELGEPLPHYGPRP